MLLEHLRTHGSSELPAERRLAGVDRALHPDDRGARVRVESVDEGSELQPGERASSHRGLSATRAMRTDGGRVTRGVNYQRVSGPL